MRLAVTSPMPGNLINSSDVAVLMLRQDSAAPLLVFDTDSFCVMREAELPLVADPAYLHVAKNEAQKIRLIGPIRPMIVKAGLCLASSVIDHTPSSSSRNSSLAKNMRGSRREIAL